MGGLEEGGFVEGFGDELEADGEVGAFVGDGAAGDADGGESGEVGGDGEDVFEIGLEGVADEFSEFVGGGGRGGGDDDVDFFEGFGEVVADEGAGFLGLEVVGVVVAGAEDVGAEEDAAFDFGAEAFGA